ncbi:MAG: 1-acyl-sn-glycerol-3-phosphate acyltransferase [Deltaproteobacteria bacterium]|nr:1-acyl-sn-glycerol-3-phosphate acyltransferase [Deltaproteobacteria bacterium]MBN2845223.1 1-acyl-sn-glycerol-3-phosphate acyltransferase [Deltaproteobacteria bacterium]
MSIRSLLQSLSEKVGAFYSGSLYREKRFPLFWILDRFLSRVVIDEESLGQLRELSQKGIVVYALKNKSQLNCLILRNLLYRNRIERPVYCQGINMLFWQPFSVALRTIISRIFHNPNKEEYLKRITKGGRSSVIYLRGSEFVGSRQVKDPLVHLINAQRELDVPIFLVPEMVAYGRKKEKKETTTMELFFGPSENPGPLRRLITFLRYSKKAFVVSSEPVNLAEFLERNSRNSLQTATYFLRREVIDRINGEKRSIVGPILKSREEIIGKVLRDEELVEFMEKMAATGKNDYVSIVNSAQKSLYEIAANYAETYIGAFDKLLSWLWNNIYDGIVIDREGLAEIRRVSKKMPFVVVPCHRSHVDYLLLSHLFYHHNIQLPFIAAGTNLLFWPLGHIFRKSGAFFIRRSFKSDTLYRKVFEKYIKVLLEEGLPIEFFIEGGRSRTGKMVMPKYGMLSMIIQAFREGTVDDLAIIPVYIGYDRVIEEKSYLKELEGGEKQKEKPSALIKSRSVLKRRYGSVYVNIGEPILLKAYLASLEVPFDEMTLTERQSLYRKMGYEIANEINDKSVVTPFALAACSLLCHFKRGISNYDLMNLMNEFYDYLDFRKVRFSSTLANREKALTDALNMLEASNLISVMGPDDDEEEEFEEIIYSVDEDKRLTLEYYKNNILHFFLPISFIATSILSSINDEISIYKIIEDYGFFKRLFRHEFIFDDAVNDAEEVNAVLSYIKERGMIAGHEDGERAWIEVKGRGRKTLMNFAGLIHNYIESYWVAIRGCTYLKSKKRQEKDLLKRIQKLGVKMYKKGEISKAEAVSQSNYNNALRFLSDSDIVHVTYSKDEKEAKIYTLTDDKIEIEVLRRKLFNFMT